MIYPPVHTEEHKGHTIHIYLDEPTESPREWDNLGTMICWHRNYTLGDDQPRESYPLHLAHLVNQLYQDDYKAHRLYREPDETRDDLHGMSESWFEHRWHHDNAQKLLDTIRQKAAILPLYLYDHSGITMNTTGFHCPWDSGQVGFIYASFENIRREYGVERISARLSEQVINQLRSEVATYDNYLRGNVYGFVVEKNGEELDSCWGFLGDYENHCLPEARNAIA